MGRGAVILPLPVHGEIPWGSHPPRQSTNKQKTTSELDVVEIVYLVEPRGIRLVLARLSVMGCPNLDLMADEA